MPSGEDRPEAFSVIRVYLAAWHSGTAVEPMIERFADRTAFEALRIDPFYRVSAERDPEVEPAIEALLQEMDGRQITLVHGDFSPKNILAGVPGELWVIDFEVTHSGDPAFDVAFMLHHLIAKSIHLSGNSDELDEYAQRFYATYRDRIDPSLAPDTSYVLRHTGAQLLARVIGKSPAPYLTAEDGERARQLAESTLLDPPESLQEMLNRRRKVSSK